MDFKILLNIIDLFTCSPLLIDLHVAPEQGDFTPWCLKAPFVSVVPVQLLIGPPLLLEVFRFG